MKNTPPLETPPGLIDDGSQVTQEPDLNTENGWLNMARVAAESSKQYMDKKHRTQIEKNRSNFNSKHPKGSKYHTKGYDHRSKLFRPKTRVAVRKNESAFAAAMFSAADVAIFEAEDGDDLSKVRDAAYWHRVVNYRLNKDIPWYQLSVGAFQRSQVDGFVVSKQYWDYKKTQSGVKKDAPCVRIVEAENFRFDPSCDWTDPIGSSPYLIELIPMYLDDVMQEMASGNWIGYTKDQILSAGVRSTNEKEKKKESTANKDFEIIWVHENIFEIDGEDFIFYTLGTQKMLSDPVPLSEIYEHGIRPFVLGTCIIEADNPIPAAPVEMSSGLQSEANDTVNQRMDNVKLAMNRRKRVLRTSNTDLTALLADVPGGIVLTDDLDGIKEEVFPDVTSSAYSEQTRLDADFDDIAGVFSMASVQTNHQLNETKGGMEMMSQYANKESEYLIRTFVETWVEPVLRQIVKLEQEYEDDDHIHEIAMVHVDRQAPVPPGTPEGELPSPMPLEEPQKVDVRVSVGFGNLNPVQRVGRIIQGIQTMVGVAPWLAGKINVEEVSSSVFGAFGHKNGGRFFTDFNPPEPQEPPELQIEKEKLRLQGEKQAELGEYHRLSTEVRREVALADVAARERMTVAQLEAKLGIERDKVEKEKAIAGSRDLAKLAEVERKTDELSFKERTGKDGI